MKLLLVLGADESYDIIAQHAGPLGYEMIRYRYVLKAMDNLDEVNPSAIIVSASDFPRHWKILVQFVRNERTKKNCPIILLKGKNFSNDECSKALYLGVNSIIDDSLESTELKQMQNVLSRHLPGNEKRKHHRFFVETRYRYGFAFVHPGNRAIVTGELKTISVGGVSFLPLSSSLVRDISLDMELDECSLRIEDDILSPVCRVARAGKIISLEFVYLPGNEKQILKNCLTELPMREFILGKGLPLPG